MARGIWMPTATGCLQNMGRLGRRAGWLQTGRPTAPANGRTKITMAGPGSMRRHGDGRRITMAVGFGTPEAADGAGGLERAGRGLSGVRRRLAFSVGAGAVWVGSRWRRMSRFTRGGEEGI